MFVYMFVEVLVYLYPLFDCKLNEEYALGTLRKPK